MRRDGVHVDLGNNRGQVAELVPAFVEDHVVDAVFSRKVDVSIVSVGVHAGTERHAIDVVEVPPVPRDLAGTYPARLTYGVIGREAVDDVALEQHLVVASDHEHRQGNSRVPARMRDPGFPFRDPLRAVSRHFGCGGYCGNSPASPPAERVRLIPG